VNLAKLPVVLEEKGLDVLLQGLLKEKARCFSVSVFKVPFGTPPVLASDLHPLIGNRRARVAAHRETPVSRISWTNGSPACLLFSNSPGVKTMGDTEDHRASFE